LARPGNYGCTIHSWSDKERRHLLAILVDAFSLAVSISIVFGSPDQNFKYVQYTEKATSHPSYFCHDRKKKGKNMWIITYRKNCVERYSDLKTELCGSYSTCCNGRQLHTSMGPYFYGSIFLRALKSEIIVLLTYVHNK
jgi:hypothetical protein